MGDNIKILKVEYLSNHLLDHTYMTKPYFVNPLNKDNLKILKVEYLSNHLLDCTQNVNLSLDDQTISYKFFK